AALVVQFGETVDPAVNDRVLALDAALRADPPAGVRELVPTYRSLMIHYDPLRLDRGTLIAIGPDIGRLAQARSGTVFSFAAVSITEAVAARREEAALLARGISVEPLLRT